MHDGGKDLQAKYPKGKSQQINGTMRMLVH